MDVGGGVAMEQAAGTAAAPAQTTGPAQAPRAQAPDAVVGGPPAAAPTPTAAGGVGGPAADSAGSSTAGEPPPAASVGTAPPRAEPAASAGSSMRPQDVVGAVSGRVVPLGRDSDDEDGDPGPRRFGLVDFAPPGGAAPGGSRRRGKRRGGGAKRRWCAKEFDAEAGRYTCSTDGHYIVKIALREPLGDRAPFVSLVHNHALSGTTFSHVDGQACVAGGMVHLRCGDSLSVQLVALPDATQTEIRKLERLTAVLSIELCMRKRKRTHDFDESGESSSGEAGAQAAAEPAQRGASKAALRRRRKKKAAAAAAAAATAASAMEGAASDASGSDHTGSDTEWSEGFSSDDESVRAARLPKRVRRLNRSMAQAEVGGGAEFAASPCAERPPDSAPLPTVSEEEEAGCMADDEDGL